MRSTRLFLCSVSMAALTAFAACGGGDNPMGPDENAEADSLLAAAIASMEDALYTALNISNFEIADLDLFSFEESNDLFQQALDASPSNDAAALGVAVTTILMLEDDSDLRGAAEEWEAWINEGPDPVGPLQTLFAVPTPLRWEVGTLPMEFTAEEVGRLSRVGLAAAELAATGGPTLAPSPSIAGQQALLSSVVAPALEAALAALEEITDASFTFAVTERMQGENPGEADVLELDYTEVLALQAGLQIALASVDVATAYSVEPNPLSVSGFVSAMTPGSDFLTLKSGGVTTLAGALDRIEAATDLLLDGLDALEAETDDQADDIIKHDPTGFDDGLTDDDIDEARNIITDIQDALSTPTTVIIDEGGPDEISFELDAQQFFTNPIDDFKTMLPGYEAGSAMEEGEQVVLFRWTDLNLVDWTFPDPTFNGILPGMTNAQLIDDFGLDDFFDDYSLVQGYFRLVAVDGLDCYDDYATGGSGCYVNGDYYFEGAVWLYGGYASMEVYGVGPYFNDYGTYSAAAGVGATYDVTLDLQTVDLSATLTDQPGYTSTDMYFRRRGGSILEFDHLGSTWTFEWQG